MSDTTFQVYDNKTRTNVDLRVVDLGGGVYALGTAPVSGAGASGTPVAGSLAATTTGQPLSPTSVPCKGVFIFQSSANADTLFGDASSQPAPVPSVPLFCPVDNVNKVYAKLSVGTGTIPWLAIT